VFSFSNFDAKRRQRLAKDFRTLAIAKLGIAAGLFFINPFLGIWLGTSALMLGGFAGGVRLLPTFNGRTSKGSRNTGRQFKISGRVSGRNHTRAYRCRSVSRTAFANGGGNDSDGGSESDSGDPPKYSFSFPVTQFQKIYRKRNSYFLTLWRILRAFDSWRLLRCQCSLEAVI